jgi:hypothetical protein
MGVSGCALIAIGCAGILYVYAFASMVGPRHGWDRWLLILQKMFLRPEVVPVLLSAFLIGAGAILGVTSLNRLFRAKPEKASHHEAS